MLPALLLDHPIVIILLKEGSVASLELQVNVSEDIQAR